MGTLRWTFIFDFCCLYCLHSLFIFFLYSQAEDIMELRSAVLELEAVVRSVQEGEDENDEVEAEREKVREVLLLLWTCVVSLIGTVVSLFATVVS